MALRLHRNPGPIIFRAALLRQARRFAETSERKRRFYRFGLIFREGSPGIGMPDARVEIVLLRKGGTQRRVRIGLTKTGVLVPWPTGLRASIGSIG